MKPVALIVALAVVIAPLAALADDETTVPAEPVTVEHPIVPLMRSEAAPWDGLLVPEARFKELIEAELRVKELEGELRIEKRMATKTEELLTARLKEATAPTPVYEKPSFNRWVGFAIGVVVTIAAVYGSYELTKAVK